MASSEQLKLVIDVAADKAIKETKSLSKAVKAVGTDAEDTRNNAERLADAFDAASDAMVADLKKSESAANALGDALGPELRAKLGNDKIDDFIAKLRRMGLSFDEVEQNADRFAMSLKRTDDASASLTNVEGGLKRIGHEGDNSRSVLANMVGNSVQDLGALGGVAGSAGVALGQMAEYAADGNITLAGFAKVAGPLAGLGIGIVGITKLIDLLNEESRDLARQTKLLVSVQEDLADRKYAEAASKLADEYGGLVTTMEKYGFTAEDVVGAIKGEIDLRPRLTKMIEENRAASKDLTDEHGQAAVQLQDIIRALNQASTAYGDAKTDIDTTTKVTGELEEALRGEADALKVTMPPLNSLITATGRWVEIQHDAEQATRDANDALLAKIDADFAAYDAQQNLIQASQDLAEAKDDEKTKVDEVDQAQKSYVRTAIDAARAIADQAEAQALANDETMSADDKQSILRDALKKTADALAPDSPVRKMLEEYIAALYRIPTDVNTRLSITGAGAGTAGRAAPGAPVGPDGVSPTSTAGPATSAGGSHGSTVNVNVRTMPTQRELTEFINNTRRRQGDVI